MISHETEMKTDITVCQSIVDQPEAIWLLLSDYAGRSWIRTKTTFEVGTVNDKDIFDYEMSGA